MLRLILVRHAKSAWDDPGLTDFDRPLALRGIAAAAWIGDTLTKHGWLPDRIVCSTSRRTRETLELAVARLPANGPRPDVVWSDAVYDRRDHDYLGLIAEQGGDTNVLMLVGHNSATENTALALSAGGEALGSFPTGGIAVLDCDVTDWMELAPRCGRLLHFLRPPKG
ncbi:MAG: histidine phosphatase family protein [Hyphomicrobiales bacterium]|nr:MAG: histidine phosphatase family protein [Hyphomicrobiales bacterium]